MNIRIKCAAAALGAAAVFAVGAQEIVTCGGGSYASYAPWRLARSTRHWGDQSRIMQTRPLYLTERRTGDPIPTNDWWTDALVSRWTGNLWSYPAKVRIDSDGVRVAFPSYWIDDGTEMKERSALVVFAVGDFKPEATEVDDWHDWDVEMVLRDGDASLRTTLVHGSPFTWIESKGVGLKISIESKDEAEPHRRAKGGGELIAVGDERYGVWRGKRADGEWIAIGLLPDEASFEKLAPYATAVIRSTRVDWKYDEKKAELTTTWRVKTEDLRGQTENPTALQGFQPHHLKRTKVGFQTLDGLVWQTPRGQQRVAAGNSLSITYPFAGLLPYWAAPGELRVENGKLRVENGKLSVESGELRVGKKTGGRNSQLSTFNSQLFKDLLADYAARGSFGGDTYWGGKGLLQMAFAMMGAREIGDEKTFRDAHAKLRAKFEDWLTWTPGEERFFFSYVPRWGGLVGEGTSYDSDAFNDHHFHYGYFTYAGALLCLVDDDFKAKFGPMLTLIARDYANWNRAETRFPFFRTFDPWAGHSFAGGVGDGGGNGQESTSEAMQGWGGLYLLGLALGNDAMRDAAIFGYVSEARGVAEYWFDRDRENIDYTKFKHPYNSNLTCHGVGWWTYFSGDPVWMHSIQWLPNTPALDYLSEDLKFAKWDWEQMWATKEIGGWFEKGRTRDGHETNPVGNESLGNVLLSYLQRHDPQQAADIFDQLRAKKMGAAVNADTGHMTYWATHSHLTWGELDFGVRADYPCARAFLKNGRRTLMVYNAAEVPRMVTFFDAATHAAVGTVAAAPRRLTVQQADGKILTTPNSTLNSPFSTLHSQLSTLVPAGVMLPDLARGRPTQVSSQENGALVGANMTDGDDTTRWGSAHDETELTAAVDLGEEVALYGVELKWENSYAARFLVQASMDGASWKTLGGERNGFEGVQKLPLNGEKTRWVRVKGLEKATQYGISLFRFSVYGRPQGATGALGMKIDADRAVLKEGVPCAVAASLWMGGDQFKPVEPEWSSADGVFGARGFTPTTNGFATVTAQSGRLAVTKRLPVEEALCVSTLAFTPTNAVAIVGEGVKIGLAATDQFGAAMKTKGLKLDIFTSDGKKVKTADYLKKGGLFIAAKPGDYTLRAAVDGVTATCTIAARARADVNLARLATVTASGEENGGLKPAFAADGSMKTRWSSRHRDGEWIQFDFGREREVSKIAIDWENARAEAYTVELSRDGATWSTVATVTHNEGGRQTHSWNRQKARCLRLTGVTRNTGYGISIFETDIR